jgi:hypothetical protein
MKTEAVIYSRGGSAHPRCDRRCSAAALMSESRQPILIALSERVPSGTVGELKPAEIGSQSQTDP